MRALLIAVVMLGGSPAEAQRLRRPFNTGHGLGTGYDNNGNGGGCSDYNCGGKCYDRHTGSDYPMPVGTDVVAAAEGTVVAVVQGCANYGYLGNPCGGRCGNHVRIAHGSGTTLYCHLQNGSITVRNGQRVGCGQKIGQSASSGSSTGPHLHMGWNPGGGAARDPYSGRCSNGGNAWVDQGPYNGAPGTQCANECDPGAEQRERCGRCGTRTRRCGGDHRWGGWSGCEGEGPCSPGDRQEEACCDCGRRSRSCTRDCRWPDWGGCDGPDPAGPPACDTGKPGDCAEGAVRCVTGCLMCVDLVEPMPEVCDDRDNDCDGPVDEDARALADPPARYAAELVDVSAPGALRPGERAEVWARFRNVGLEPWPAHATWISTGGPSGLWDEAIWSAHDAPQPLERDVAPGEVATVMFPVRMPMDRSEPVTTDFGLVVQGTPIACPAPGFAVSPVRLSARAEGAEAEDAPAPAPRDEDAGTPPPARADDDDEKSAFAGGCSQGSAPASPWALLLAAVLLARRRRRAHGR